MSTIRADYISPSAGGTSKSLVRGTAAAWVNFNGTGTIAARDSENVSSLTDNGTGDHTVNFSNAFDVDNYSIVGSVTAQTGDNTASRHFHPFDEDNILTGSCRVRSNFVSATSNISVDYPYFAVSIHGDLA